MTLRFPVDPRMVPAERSEQQHQTSRVRLSAPSSAAGFPAPETDRQHVVPRRRRPLDRRARDPANQGPQCDGIAIAFGGSAAGMGRGEDPLLQRRQGAATGSRRRPCAPPASGPWPAALTVPSAWAAAEAQMPDGTPRRGLSRPQHADRRAASQPGSIGKAFAVYRSTLR